MPFIAANYKVISNIAQSQDFTDKDGFMVAIDDGEWKLVDNTDKTPHGLIIEGGTVERGSDIAALEAGMTARVAHEDAVGQGNRLYAKSNTVALNGGIGEDVGAVSGDISPCFALEDATAPATGEIGYVRCFFDGQIATHT